ncbi:hypothetical protein ACTXT7_010672 [Hymenolepis weldensis]
MFFRRLSDYQNAVNQQELITKLSSVPSIKTSMRTQMIVQLNVLPLFNALMAAHFVLSLQLDSHISIVYRLCLQSSRCNLPPGQSPTFFCIYHTSTQPLSISNRSTLTVRFFIQLFISLCSSSYFLSLSLTDNNRAGFGARKFKNIEDDNGAQVNMLIIDVFFQFHQNHCRIDVNRWRSDLCHLRYQHLCFMSELLLLKSILFN